MSVMLFYTEKAGYCLFHMINESVGLSKAYLSLWVCMLCGRTPDVLEYCARGQSLERPLEYRVSQPPSFIYTCPARSRVPRCTQVVSPILLPPKCLFDPSSYQYRKILDNLTLSISTTVSPKIGVIKSDKLKNTIWHRECDNDNKVTYNIRRNKKILSFPVSDPWPKPSTHTTRKVEYCDIPIFFWRKFFFRTDSSTKISEKYWKRYFLFCLKDTSYYVDFKHGVLTETDSLLHA